MPPDAERRARVWRSDQSPERKRRVAPILINFSYKPQRGAIFLDMGWRRIMMAAVLERARSFFPQEVKTMRRIVLSVLVGGGLLAGCQNAQKDMEPEQRAAVDYGVLEPDFYVSDASIVANPVAPTTDYEMQSGPSSIYEPATTPGQTHVVAKGDTLFGLARLYYNDASRWKDIYEANGVVLSDPNELRVGQELVIP